MQDGPSFEQVKAQAAVLVPLVKLLRQEIGVERANDIVVRALAEWARSIGKMLREIPAPTPLAKLKTAIEGLDAAGMQQTEFLQATETQLDYNVRRCRAAEFYRDLGLEELGYLLCASSTKASCRRWIPKYHSSATRPSCRAPR